MTDPVNVNGRGRDDRPEFCVIARQAWGADVPEWVVVLAAECDRTTQTAAAKRIGRSAGLVSQVLRRTYEAKGGDMVAVETVVRGALMGETVICPVLDEIGRDWCLIQQGMPRTGASAVRARIYNACRSGCPHSRIKGGDDGE